MAWTKIPKEHHPIFLAALPTDPRASTMPMFGGVCGMVNGNIFGGLFGRSVMLNLDDDAKREALALEGAGPFDPMGNGRVRSDKVMMPESLMSDPAVLRRWLARAFEYVATLPPKEKKAKPAKKVASAKKVTPAKKVSVAKKKVSPAKKKK